MEDIVYNVQQQTLSKTINIVIQLLAIYILLN